MHVVSDRVRDTAEYMLLSRAVDRLGAHKLGDEWVSAHKLRPFVWLSSPDTGNAELADQRFAAAQYLYRYARHVLFPRSDDATKQAGRLNRRPKILARIMPRDEAESLRSQLEKTLANLNLTESQYEFAFRMTQQDKAGWNNLHAIREKIVELCQDGEIASAARPIPGGAFVPLDKAFWNTERWAEWFKHSTVNLQSPYNFDEPDHYVFISRADLKILCGEPDNFHQNISENSAEPIVPTADASGRSGGPGAPPQRHLIEHAGPMNLQQAVEHALSTDPDKRSQTATILRAIRDTGWTDWPEGTWSAIFGSLQLKGSNPSQSTFYRVRDDLNALLYRP